MALVCCGGCGCHGCAGRVRRQPSVICRFWTGVSGHPGRCAGAVVLPGAGEAADSRCRDACPFCSGVPCPEPASFDQRHARRGGAAPPGVCHEQAAGPGGVRDVGPGGTAVPRRSAGGRPWPDHQHRGPGAGADGVAGERDPRACAGVGGCAGHVRGWRGHDPRDLHPPWQWGRWHAPGCRAARGQRADHRSQRQRPGSAEPQHAQGGGELAVGRRGRQSALRQAGQWPDRIGQICRESRTDRDQALRAGGHRRADLPSPPAAGRPGPPGGVRAQRGRHLCAAARLGLGLRCAAAGVVS